jgi:hypothetical protein
VLIQQKNEKIQNTYLCGVSVVMFNVKDFIISCRISDAEGQTVSVVPLPFGNK